MTASLLPIALKLEERQVLVVGGGPVALSKLSSLVDARARVRLVAPETTQPAGAPRVEYHARRFHPSDLDGCWLVIAAATPEVNREVARHAEERRVFVIAADDPENATAYGTAIVRRGELVLSVSTEGAAPALSALVREALDELVPEDTADWVETARSLRRRWRLEQIEMSERRPLLLRALNRLYEPR